MSITPTVSIMLCMTHRNSLCYELSLGRMHTHIRPLDEYGIPLMNNHSCDIFATCSQDNNVIGIFYHYQNKAYIYELERNPLGMRLITYNPNIKSLYGCNRIDEMNVNIKSFNSVNSYELRVRVDNIGANYVICI